MPSITIQINYTFDSNHFFDTQAKKDVLQQAANVLGSALADSLTAIVPLGGDTWSAKFFDPATGNDRLVDSLVVPADTLVVFAGGRPLSGSETGQGGPGGFNASGSAGWLNLVKARGQAGALLSTPTDFSPWGGAVSFDNSASTHWFFGKTTQGLAQDQIDFLSVATHELGHILGIGNIIPGVVTSWSRNIVNNQFLGPQAEAANGGAPVPLQLGGNHWAQGTKSDGVGVAMAPILLNGQRRLFTRLDFAGLSDIGWDVQGPTTVQFSTSVSNVNEDAGKATVTVMRIGNLSGSSTVHYTSSDGSARDAVDYKAATGTLNFGPNQDTATFFVTILNDSAADADETVLLSLDSPTGATLGPVGTSILTIVDNDRPPAFSGGDFDGDHKAELAVFRPSNAVWLGLLTDGGVMNTVYGLPNFADIPVAADYDRDGRSDLAVFRVATAQWIIANSGGSAPRVVNFGASNLFDIPVPADYDGDGKADLAVFRPSTAQWIILNSSGIPPRVVTFGAPNLFDVPVPADFDGDGKADLAVFRRSTAQWLILNSGGSPPRIVPFGAPNLFDLPVPADYDGDHKADLAVFRPSTSEWLILNSGGGPPTITRFGAPNLFDLPIEAPIAALKKLGRVRIAAIATVLDSASNRSTVHESFIRGSVVENAADQPRPAVSHPSHLVSKNPHPLREPRVSRITGSVPAGTRTTRLLPLVWSHLGRRHDSLLKS